MFIIAYILITICACVMVYFGYQQGMERFYMCLFSAAVVLYCLYLDFKKRVEKKKEKEKAAQMKGNKKNKNSKTVSESGKKQSKLNSASKVKGGQNVSIRDAAHKSTKDKDVNTSNK